MQGGGELRMKKFILLSLLEINYDCPREHWELGTSVSFVLFEALSYFIPSVIKHNFNKFSLKI